MCGRLDGCLFLCEPLNWGFVEQMYDACHRSPRYPVVVQVSVLVGRSFDGFAQWIGDVRGYHFLNVTVDRV